jgi:ABC-type multidrug transport system ATPase subunit/pSer/pThr/pTyr-binding forkhead associated (FHA) protein
MEPMKIVISEIVAEEEQARYEFDHRAVIQLGRDPQQCDVIFDPVSWPMVSRVHAELRVEGNQCLLVDNNSTQGTFLNKQSISEPIAIKTGTHIQFGQGGPVVVVHLTPGRPDVPIGLSEIDPDLRKWVGSAAVDQSQHATGTELHRVPTLIFEQGIPAERGSHLVLKPGVTVLGRDSSADLILDASSAGVSRRHAEIRLNDEGRFQIDDLNTINGTLVNGKIIAQPTILNDGDRIQLSAVGPVLRFVDPAALQLQQRSKSRELGDTPIPKSTSEAETSLEERRMSGGLNTLVYRRGVSPAPQAPVVGKAKDTPLVQCTFDGKERLSVGRATDNDIQLDGLLISKYHARFFRTARALLIEDAGSTNGVYVNGARVSGRRPVQSEDIIQIGPFVLKADPIIGVSVFDTRSETRIDAFNITDVVPGPHGAAIKLLDEISLAIQPNEFVGLLGPSGAGKSTFMNVLNGMRQTSSGLVLMNSLDLYQHFYSLKQSIGYVPQDDIIHRELTCYNTLYYVARLRLSRDVPAEDLDQIINEVLEVTGLTERRDTKISKLSGGQRKRVSIAVELITKPSVIFLDEPTSGLDPATEERIMKLFRQIAESGRTVILTTHAMENVHLFDKIVLLMRGKLIFYGSPDEALAFVGASNFIELYNKLEESLPVEARAPASPLPEPDGTLLNQPQQRGKNEEEAAEQWRQLFAATETYKRNIAIPLSLVQQEGKTGPAIHLGHRTVDSLFQWLTLVARYARILASDRLNLLILLGQAPIVAIMTCLVVGKHDSRDFIYFVLALIPLWFGTSVAAREIVKERSVYKRERMVNLGLMPYVGSKLFTLSWIVGLQCVLLFGTLKVFHFAKLIYLPGVFGGSGQWLTMVVTGVVGIAMGLFISALVRTSEMATSIVPLLLIPQILFCGLVGVPTGPTRYVSAVMPATWSFDEMKRLSNLDTLLSEGSDPKGPNKGLGLYKYLQDLNLKSAQKASTALEEYTRRSNESLAEHDRRIKVLIQRGDSKAILSAQPPVGVGSPPAIPQPEILKDDLSSYVTFKHSWGGVLLNPLILLAMFFALVAATLIVLRSQDPRAQKSR